MNIRILVAIALFTLPLSAHAKKEKFSDGWRYRALGAKVNPFFSEFKYFNFQDANISGAMTYSVISPGLSRSLRLNAFFYESGRLTTIQKTYPLRCVKASSKDVSADLCKEGGIKVLAWDAEQAKIHVWQDTGPLRWDFTITAPMSEVTAETTHIPLDSKFPLKLDRILVDWWMNWSPVVRSGQVNGTVTFVEKNRIFDLNTETSYHDENWEIWYPKTQPFNWLHFTAKDSRDERADLMLVEFPNNTAKTTGLTLYSRGVKKFYPRGSYQLIKEGTSHIPITRHVGKDAEKVRELTVDPNFSDGEHEIPLRYTITTDDDQIHADLVVRSALSSSSAEAGSSNDVLVDEQIVDANIRFLTPTGEHRTAQGPAEFMNTSGGD